MQKYANERTLWVKPVALLGVRSAAKGMLADGEPGSLVGMLASHAAEELAHLVYPRGFRRCARTDAVRYRGGTER